MVMLKLRYEKYTNGTAIKYFFNPFLKALLPVWYGRMWVCILLTCLDRLII